MERRKLRSNGRQVVWSISDHDQRLPGGVEQAFITLSVMEAELLEASTATLLLENIGCLLDELTGEHVKRHLFVDNASAVAMITGGPGSWRTRHLKVRSAKIREQVENQELDVQHVGGLGQLADLATKMHPKARLWELLLLWGFKDLPKEANECLQMKSMYLACLVMAMMCQPAQGQDTEEARKPIQIAGVDELVLVTALVCVATVALWEAFKWTVSFVKRACRESPKQRKLRRLREAAKAAAEEEVDRAVINRSMESDDVPLTPRPIQPPTRKSPIVHRDPDPPQQPVYPTGCIFEPCAPDAFYKTDSNRSKLHTDPRCHGLRNSGTVYRVEYCTYCARNEPLYVKRARSVPRGTL